MQPAKAPAAPPLAPWLLAPASIEDPKPEIAPARLRSRGRTERRFERGRLEQAKRSAAERQAAKAAEAAESGPAKRQEHEEVPVAHGMPLGYEEYARETDVPEGANIQIARGQVAKDVKPKLKEAPISSHGGVQGYMPSGMRPPVREQRPQWRLAENARL